MIVCHMSRTMALHLMVAGGRHIGQVCGYWLNLLHVLVPHLLVAEVQDAVLVQEGIVRL